MPATTLKDLAFLSGSWGGELHGGTIEEQWAAPLGTCMMGMFRFVKDGKPRFYEFMTLEETGAGLELRIKHFHPGLVGWEEKAECLCFHVKKFGTGYVIFEMEESTTNLTFKSASPEELRITLEKPDQGGEGTQEFSFRRI